MAHFPPIRSSTSRDGQFRIEGSDRRAANEAMTSVPGLRNKTWLSGVGAHSIGGFYEFDSETVPESIADGLLTDGANASLTNRRRMTIGHYTRR